MKRYVGLLVALLLANSLVFIFHIMPTKAVGTVYIHSDGTIDPPGTPISSGDKITFTLTGDIYSSITVERSNIVIDGASHLVGGDGTGEGFKLVSVNSVTIKNTKIEDFTYGIYIESTSFTVVRENNITANSYDGIGIFQSLNTTIYNNTIAANEYDGVEYYDSSFGNITGNRIYSNMWFGLGVYFSSNNSIFENTFLNNYQGIELVYSSDNLLFHNNFVNQTLQVFTENSVNAWDNGRQGNYWSDYNGTDVDDDEVGDTPYVIDESNVDRYPLMYIYWNPCDINHDLLVNMKDVAGAAKAFSTEPGDPFWNPHADITGPEPLVPDGKVDMRDISLIARNFGKVYQ